MYVMVAGGRSRNRDVRGDLARGFKIDFDRGTIAFILPSLHLSTKQNIHKSTEAQKHYPAPRKNSQPRTHPLATFKCNKSSIPQSNKRRKKTPTAPMINPYVHTLPFPNLRSPFHSNVHWKRTRGDIEKNTEDEYADITQQCILTQKIKKKTKPNLPSLLLLLNMHIHLGHSRCGC